MGRPSASEAPSGPSGHSEKDTAPPPEASSSHGSSSVALPLPFPRARGPELPPKLRLRAERGGELSFVGRWPPTAPLLFCPILLVISSLGWISPEPLGAERLSVSAL